MMTVSGNADAQLTVGNDSLRPISIDEPIDEDSLLAARMAGVEVSLLTCSPHEEVYSLYGHTALLITDRMARRQWVFNYGVFDYRKPHFVWRFMMGQTDYRLESTPALLAWCDYYRRWGSSVEAQVLDLTPREKLQLQTALAENLKTPVYRYNFFFDNCSTRPRDIIERSLDGTVSYAERPGYEPTLRQMVHECTGSDHRWAAFGNDLLLGFRADQKTTQRERQFLPASLSWDFDHATVVRGSDKRPLVLRRVTLIPQGQQTVKQGFPLSPLACTLFICLLIAAVTGYELHSKRQQVWFDGVMMLLTGVAGCLLTLMFFSEHPATSTNLQVLLLNPLALLFLPQVIRRRKTLWWKLQGVCLLLFLLGALVQDYAEGLEFVALFLLIRLYLTHYHDQ